MKKLLLALIGLFVLGSAPAFAANCSTYPYTLTNGALADANQVMANFNSILNCANNNLIAGGANSTITSLSGLTTPLSVAQGGSGLATLPADRLLMGNGTSSMNSVASGTSGQVLTSNGASAPTFQALPTALAAYNGSGTANATHIVSGQLGTAPGGTGTITLTGAAVFANVNYNCTITPTGSTPASFSYAVFAANSFTIYGPGSTTFSYICIGQ